KELGVREVVFDTRIQEIHLGSLSGCHDARYHELYPTFESKFERAPQNGESLRDVRKRMAEFLADTEKQYTGKNILIISHEYPIWMAHHVAAGWTEGQAIREKESREKDFINFA